MTTMVRATTLTGYLRVAHRHGLDPLAVLAEVGIDPAGLGTPDFRIPISAACRLLELSAARAQCPTLGLEMAQLRQKSDVGVLGILLAHQRTLRAALYAIVQYRSLLNEALGVHIESSDQLVTIREALVADDAGPSAQAMELAIGVLTKLCRGLLGPRWKPRQVHFTHAAPAERHLHRAFFDCPVSFGSDFNGIVCAAADLDTPNPAADPELVHYAETLMRPLNPFLPGSLTLEVRKMIYLLLPMEQASIGAVASKLNLSSRTLQRQLAEQGTDFSSLLGDVRHELALRYLSNRRYPVGRIAALLGFGRQASFTRWFIGRCGMPPRAWRRRAGPPL